MPRAGVGRRARRRRADRGAAARRRRRDGRGAPGGSATRRTSSRRGSTPRSLPVIASERVHEARRIAGSSCSIPATRNCADPGSVDLSVAEALDGGDPAVAERRVVMIRARIVASSGRPTLPEGPAGLGPDQRLLVVGRGQDHLAGPGSPSSPGSGRSRPGSRSARWPAFELRDQDLRRPRPSARRRRRHAARRACRRRRSGRWGLVVLDPSRKLAAVVADCSPGARRSRQSAAIARARPGDGRAAARVGRSPCMGLSPDPAIHGDRNRREVRARGPPAPSLVRRSPGRPRAERDAIRGGAHHRSDRRDRRKPNPAAATADQLAPSGGRCVDRSAGLPARPAILDDRARATGSARPRPRTSMP